MRNLEFGLNFLKLADFENSEFLRSFSKGSITALYSHMYYLCLHQHLKNQVFKGFQYFDIAQLPSV